MFTAPTALRAIRQADPALERLDEVGNRDGLKSLRTLFLAGERLSRTSSSNLEKPSAATQRLVLAWLIIGGRPSPARPLRASRSSRALAGRGQSVFEHPIDGTARFGRKAHAGV